MIEISEIPKHLHFFVLVPTHILNDLLKNGMSLKYSTPEYDFLHLNQWRRGEERHIRKIIQGKESGTLNWRFPGDEEDYFPSKETWDAFNADWLKEKQDPEGGYSPTSPPLIEQYFYCCKYYGAHASSCSNV